jgi:hypothetical protein
LLPFIRCWYLFILLVTILASRCRSSWDFAALETQSWQFSNSWRSARFEQVPHVEDSSSQKLWQVDGTDLQWALDYTGSADPCWLSLFEFTARFEYIPGIGEALFQRLWETSAIDLHWTPAVLIELNLGGCPGGWIWAIKDAPAQFWWRLTVYLL